MRDLLLVTGAGLWLAAHLLTATATGPDPTPTTFLPMWFCRFGAIGRRVAELARAYQMRVVALQRDCSRAQPDLASRLLVSILCYTLQQYCQQRCSCRDTYFVCVYGQMAQLDVLRSGRLLRCHSLLMEPAVCM
jgi:hypothetical protein